uniref:Ig-like domain-containing protein n=1 Tax=Strix occidentalis caurina TaxID=311401 RepID=A0A8D0FA14_STROC
LPLSSAPHVALTLAESWHDHGLFFLTAAVTGQVALEQHIREVAVQEGDGVTFQCSTSGDCMSSYIMFWYQQGPRGSLDWIYREGDAYGEGFQGGFKGRVLSSQNRLTLQMQAAKQGDEAVYYCGAWCTVEQLCSTVLREPPAREYRSLKDDNTGKAACLARNFYTKNISLEMSSNEVVYEQSTSIFTSERLYNTFKVVSVTKDTEVTCTAKFNGKTITANTTSPGTFLLYSCNLFLEAPWSLPFLFLLAKSIAFNTLMSVKLFLF